MSILGVTYGGGVNRFARFGGLGAAGARVEDRSDGFEGFDDVEGGVGYCDKA